MTQTLDDRLDEAIRRRDDAAAKKQRIEGRLEAAKTALEEVEAECREKGVDPENLDATIDKLAERYGAAVEQLEQEVEAAESALAPFLKES